VTTGFWCDNNLRSDKFLMWQVCCDHCIVWNKTNNTWLFKAKLTNFSYIVVERKLMRLFLLAQLNEISKRMQTNRCTWTHHKWLYDCPFNSLWLGPIEFEPTISCLPLNPKIKVQDNAGRFTTEMVSKTTWNETTKYLLHVVFFIPAKTVIEFVGTGACPAIPHA
jgi:hypothetical protein